MRHIFFRLWALLLVEGVSGDEKVGVTVMEGDSVTLKHGGSEVQTGDLIVWKFKDSIIINIKKTAEVSTSNDVLDERFRGRLKLDQTGSLTITHIRTTDSGLYQLNIRSLKEVSKEYSVTVSDVFSVDSDGVKSVSVTEGDSVTLHTGVTQKQRDDVIQWKFGDQDLNGPVDARWRNIHLNDETGEITIRNIQRDQTGDYKMEINTSRMILHRKFRINISDVFSDEKDGVKTVSETRGDSVLLHTHVTDIQQNDPIEWTFGPQNISVAKTDGKSNSISYNYNDERFKNRLYLDIRTGDLTIKKSSSEHSGLYQLKIITSSYTIQKSFSVTVSDESNTEMEGDSVTLNPDLTQIQGFNLIEWKFEDKVIAETDGNEISYPHFTEIFGGRLQLDHQTGSLTINNTRTKHSGLYKLQISHNTGTSYMTLSVNVSESKDAFIDVGEAEMKTLSVMAGYPVTLQTDVTETHGDQLIVWRFGDEGKLIAKHDLEAKSSTLYMTDERFRDRLKLDHQTGSLTITDTRTTDSGLYRVKISSNKQTIYKRFTVTVSDPGLSAGAVAGIVVAVVLLVVFAAVAGVIYHRRKISELQSRRDV